MSSGSSSMQHADRNWICVFFVVRISWVTGDYLKWKNRVSTKNRHDEVLYKCAMPSYRREANTKKQQRTQERKMENRNSFGVVAKPHVDYFVLTLFRRSFQHEIRILAICLWIDWDAFEKYHGWAWKELTSCGLWFTLFRSGWNEGQDLCLAEFLNCTIAVSQTDSLDLVFTWFQCDPLCSLVGNCSFRWVGYFGTPLPDEFFALLLRQSHKNFY